MEGSEPRSALRRQGARAWMAAGVVMAVLAATVVAAPADQRLDEIKRRLERFGLKVLDVSVAPAKGTAPAVWAAGTAGTYSQPNWDRVIDQALTVWNVMFAILKTEDPQTLFLNTQDWKTYRLFVATKLTHVTTMDAALRSSKTDGEKAKAMQTLYGTITFKVFDLQQQKMIDEKEFIKTHFGK